jgi:hypothetical protein
VSPDDPRHGTNAGYSAGCRDACCRLAHNAYRRRVWRRCYTLRTDALHIDSTGTIRRIRALQALGWRFMDIDTAMGCDPNSPNASRCHNYTHHPKVHIDNALAVAAVYERLSMTFGPSAALRRMAPRKGWAPPLCWDEDTIDDPDAEPAGLTASHNTDVNRTRAAELLHFAHLGDTLDTVCDALDVTPDALWLWCKRHGHRDLYERLAERRRVRDNQYTGKAGAA